MLVLVSRDALEALIQDDYAMRQDYALEGGAKGVNERLDPADPLVTLAVEAGITIPGPLTPGSYPPVPPRHHFDVQRVFDLIEQCLHLVEDIQNEEDDNAS